MKLSDSDLERLHSLALIAAERAGSHIQSMVGRHRETRTKDTGDTPASQVVTEVDLESQRLILETLHESIDEYGLGLLTEERADDSSRLETDHFWCIDPLDGTLPFVEGSPGYSVSIALVSRAGEALLGVVNDPTKEDTFHALEGRGAFLNGESIPEPLDTNGKSLTWIMDRSMRDTAAYPWLMKSIERLAADTDHAGLNFIGHAGAALNGSWVTQHAPAIYVKFPKPTIGGGSLWDFAASACLLKEWGRPATDVFGSPLELNRADNTFMNERGVIYASDPELREAVQRIYRLSVSA
jgi:myo-inositol-1(or 4)-monophosphatase